MQTAVVYLPRRSSQMLPVTGSSSSGRPWEGVPPEPSTFLVSMDWRVTGVLRSVAAKGGDHLSVPQFLGCQFKHVFISVWYLRWNLSWDLQRLMPKAEDWAFLYQIGSQILASSYYNLVSASDIMPNPSTTFPQPPSEAAFSLLSERARRAQRGTLSDRNHSWKK